MAAAAICNNYQHLNARPAFSYPSASNNRTIAGAMGFSLLSQVFDGPDLLQQISTCDAFKYHRARVLIFPIAVMLFSCSQASPCGTCIETDGKQGGKARRPRPAKTTYSNASFKSSRRSRAKIDYLLDSLWLLQPPFSQAGGGSGNRGSIHVAPFDQPLPFGRVSVINAFKCPVRRSALQGTLLYTEPAYEFFDVGEDFEKKYEG